MNEIINVIEMLSNSQEFYGRLLRSIYELKQENETAYGLDANNPDDGNANTLDPAGKYTNLEMYLHSLVQDIIKKQQQ